jgi:hypothetical protein
MHGMCTTYIGQYVEFHVYYMFTILSTWAFLNTLGFHGLLSYTLEYF